MSQIERHNGERRPLWQRLFWFAAFWLLGVAAVGALAYAIRLIIKSQFPEA